MKTAKLNKRNIPMRILMTLLGIALILWGIGTVILGIMGEWDSAVITHIRRQGGERSDSRPGRYTYIISYTFTLPDGKRIDGFTTKISDSVYIKANGTSKAPVRYLKKLPFINSLEENTELSVGQLVLVVTGGFIIVVMNKSFISTKKLQKQ